MKHPTGQMDQVKGKDPVQILSAATDVAASMSEPGRPHCPNCNYGFMYHSVNKARSSGKIVCPRCGRCVEIKDIVFK